MKTLSVIVVSWNCASFIERFIRELEASLQEVESYEVLILDNASTDGTADLIEPLLPKGFNLVRSEVNLGFAMGNNFLIRQAAYENIALLNPDVFDFPDGFWTKIEAARTREEADVAFVKLCNTDGSFQDCIGEFPSFFRAWTTFLGKAKDFSKLDVPTRIDVGIMAFLLTTKEVFNKVGLIDEDFHMYCEDVEWCYRVARSGRKIIYLPELSLTHVGGASASKRWNEAAKRKVKLYSEILFIRKHYKGWMKLSSMLTTRIKISLSTLNHIAYTFRKAG